MARLVSHWFEITLTLVLLTAAPEFARGQNYGVASTATTSMLAEICRKSPDLTANFCAGYIMATFDTLSSARSVCPGSGVTTEQVMAVAKRFLAEHPELWDRHPMFVVRAAFEGAFPCPLR